ncbi:putative reverse transcriptase domain-containing protein, partial [Tanacetum coccineum]
MELIKRLQTQMAELERQQGPAKGPAHPELLEEAGIIFSCDLKNMAPKRAMRLNIAPKTTNTTSVTNAQLQAMINQGVTTALAARDANTNGVDSHNSGTGARRNERATQNQIKFSTCTLLGNALTWRNSHVRTIGNDVAYAMTWTELKKKITDKYCPRNKIKKLEVELWELKVKESNKIEKYVDGLPDMIHGSVVASKPKTMQEATKMAIDVMDKRICTFADRQRERVKGSLRIPQGTLRTNDNKTRGRTLVGPTLQGLVRRSHTGDLNPYALNEIITMMVHVLQNATNATKLAILPLTVGVRINPDSNVVTGTFLLNNRYASILFDIGADRSF